jgi:GxxExxY protein
MLTKIETPIPQEVEDIGRRVIGCGITVHRILGPGFRERIYKRAFCLELEEQGLSYECEKRILVPYKRWRLDGIWWT